MYIELSGNLFVSIHVPVVRQHCAQMEGFAFSHIISINEPRVICIYASTI